MPATLSFVVPHASWEPLIRAEAAARALPNPLVASGPTALARLDGSAAIGLVLTPDLPLPNLGRTPSAALVLAEGPLPSQLRLALPERAIYEAALARLDTVTVGTLGSLVEATALLAASGAQRSFPQSPGAPPPVTPMTIDGTGIMDEHETDKLLDRWGIPVVPGTLVTGPGRHEFTPIRKLATNFNFPVVLKAIREDIVHKTELGAVVVGVPNVNELSKTWETMHERFPDAAWLVQPYLPGDLEVIVAAQRHPTLGPVVSVGPGGIMKDLYGDVAVRAAPLTIQDAEDMIAETKLQALMQGFKGLPPHDPREVAEVLVNVGWLMHGQPQVQELEIGPLLLTEKGPIAVGAKAAIG